MSSLPRIAGYDVQERLGSGGMGDVYKAVSLEDRRSVAVKIEGEIVALDRESGLRVRFLREARILQGLEHENLPEFYGAGELADGRLFIAMELLVGRPLSRFAGSSLAELLPLLTQAATALQVVSEAGVVHRDVSPDNFFVVEVGGRSVVKLIDFGISRDVEAAKDGLTRVGAFVGKPAYCSPEQTGLLPDSGPVDWRTDLYSFGVTLYFLLLKRLPFPQGNVLELLRARLKDLPRESFQDIRSERLRRLVMRLLRLKPEDRPDSFEEVVTELLHVQAELVTETARRMEDSWKLRRKATDRQRRGEPLCPPPNPAEPAPPAVSAAPPRAATVGRESSLGQVLLAPRALLMVSITLLGGAFLLFLLGVARTRSLGASGLIVLAVALAALAAARERALRRHASRPDAARPAADLAAGAVPEYIGDPSAGEPLPFSLLVTGDGPPREVVVVRERDGAPPPEVLIGRSVGPDGVHLSSKTVSGVQARLVRAGEQYLIENLSGTNPTRINARPLRKDERRRLRHGDRIEMAQVAIVFRTGPR